jgi:hypothetical protein
MKSSRRISRSSRRGAAMVEAVVLLPVMLAFFSFLTYSHLSYSMRINLQSQTRLDVARIAVAGCNGGGQSESGFAGACGAGGPQMGSFSTKSERSGTVAVGQLNRTTKGRSYMLCNEQGAGGSAEESGKGINVSESPGSPSAGTGCQ